MTIHWNNARLADVTTSRLSPAADDLERPLALARHLLLGVEQFARSLGYSRSLGLLDDVELPPIIRDEADVAQLQAVAPLYLASELEAAQLLPAIELLAALFVSGGLRVEDEAASAALYAFWQRRHERFSQAERQDIFARVFGAVFAPTAPIRGNLPLARPPSYPATGVEANKEFEVLLLGLAEALLEAEANPRFPPMRPPNVPPSQSAAMISAAAEALIANLLPRSGGITAFASRELALTISDALAIAKMRAVQASLGAAALWPAIQAAMLRYKQRQVQYLPHIRRGKSGMLLLTWLAEISPQVGGSSGAIGMSPSLPPAPIFAAAATWLNASAELHGFAQRFETEIVRA